MDLHTLVSDTNAQPSNQTNDWGCLTPPTVPQNATCHKTLRKSLQMWRRHPYLKLYNTTSSLIVLILNFLRLALHHVTELWTHHHTPCGSKQREGWRGCRRTQTLTVVKVTMKDGGGWWQLLFANWGAAANLTTVSIIQTSNKGARLLLTQITNTHRAPTYK